MQRVKNCDRAAGGGAGGGAGGVLSTFYVLTFPIIWIACMSVFTGITWLEYI